MSQNGLGSLFTSFILVHKIMGLLLVYLCLSIGVSFMCSILEASILSVTPSFIELKEQEGHPRAGKLRALRDNIDRPLSAILSLNTVANTVGAASVGAQAMEVFGEAYFALFSAVLTLVILIFAEIIPKTIGSRFWRSIALPSTALLQVMIYIAFPLVFIAKLVSSLIAGKDKATSVSREEIDVLTQIGTQEGVFEESEGKVIRNMIRLKEVLIRSIMTPRTVVVKASEDISLEEFFKSHELIQHSRIPLYSGDTDNFTGYVLKYDILTHYAKGQRTEKLKSLKRPLLFSYESFNIAELFQTLIKEKEHISMIVDEYGSVVGMVTMEDIIETMLGLEILDEKDNQVDMQQLAKEKWKIRAQKLKVSHLDDDKPA